MEIAIYPPMQGRPCRFCLTLQGCSVFADFDVDAGHVFLVRISYDGYGCCRAPEDIGRMTAADSNVLLAMIDRDSIDHEAAEPILRRYFHQHREALWVDALAHHDLI